jgi:truncated hemoglobin YjbI
MRCISGTIPARAQSGLSAELIAKSYFLPCVCKNTDDIQLADALPDDFFVTAQLEQRVDDQQGGITFLFEPLRSLATTITAVVVRDEAGHKARYTLSNQPEIDFYFGIHLPANDLSDLAARWRNHLQVGAQIEMREALPSDSIETSVSTPPDGSRPKDLPPDPELWAALNNGALLQTILQNFYARVYADAQLAPFFSGVTQQRLVEKQYSFLHQLITGNKVYFGNRPRTTHHWMVISDELFEHREHIMLACLQAQGLSEKWIARLQQFENHYRPDIVKSTPFPRQIDGVDLPLEGFDELVMDVGSMCDGCGGVIAPGETVRYHLRRGTTFCARCIQQTATLPDHR